jgi:hypothetical protein
MRNGRCRLHGGKSTGPRTEEGRARIRAARTRHGRYTAEGRAFQSNITGLLRRSRELLRHARQPGAVDAEALRHLLPAELGKHPLHRDHAVTPAKAGAQGLPPDGKSAALGPRFREDDGGSRPTTTVSAQKSLQPEKWVETQMRPGARGCTQSPIPETPPAPAPRRPILLARPTPQTPWEPPAARLTPSRLVLSPRPVTNPTSQGQSGKTPLAP